MARSGVAATEQADARDPGAAPGARGAPFAPVPAVRKAVLVVRFLDARAPAGARLDEIAGGLGITRSHCHNILRTLAAAGWVAYDGGARLWRLDGGLLADTRSVLNAAEPVSDLRPVMARLAREVRLLCVLSRLEPDGSFLVVDKVEGGSELGLSVPIAHRFPPDAPVQRKAALAWQDEAGIDTWLDAWTPIAYTAASITDKARLRAELAETRRRGYALSEGEFIHGVTSVGLPLFDRAGRVAMILQCPGLTEVVEARVPAIARALQAAVGEMHRLTGAAPPPDFPLRDAP